MALMLLYSSHAEALVGSAMILGGQVVFRRCSRALMLVYSGHATALVGSAMGLGGLSSL